VQRKIPQFIVASNGAVSGGLIGDQATTKSIALIVEDGAQEKHSRRDSGIFGGIDIAIKM
jgi:hypothetical protein